VPHAPQLPLSVVRSRQTPLQLVKPAEHDVVHLLALQMRPGGHTVPHAPQFVSSFVRSRHAPPQSVVPDAQLSAHALPLHT